MSKYTLDTRDLYKRQQELQDLKGSVESAEEELKDAEKALAAYEEEDPSTDPEGNNRDELETAARDAQTALDDAKAEFGDDEQTELAELDDLESEVGNEWRHGETMIPENSFEDYARELAEDIGAVPDDLKWPCTCIDWEQAAKELAMDYTMVSYQGEDYYVRA